MSSETAARSKNEFLDKVLANSDTEPRSRAAATSFKMLEIRRGMFPIERVGIVLTAERVRHGTKIVAKDAETTRGAKKSTWPEMTGMNEVARAKTWPTSASLVLARSALMS